MAYGKILAIHYNKFCLFPKTSTTPRFSLNLTNLAGMTFNLLGAAIQSIGRAVSMSRSPTSITNTTSNTSITNTTITTSTSTYLKLPSTGSAVSTARSSRRTTGKDRQVSTSRASSLQEEEVNTATN